MKKTMILSPLSETDDIEKAEIHDKNYQKIKDMLDKMKFGEDISFDESLEKLSLTEDECIFAIRSSLKREKVFLKRNPSEIKINNYSDPLMRIWPYNTFSMLMHAQNIYCHT